MITLIAESKTMTACDSHVPDNELHASLPLTDATATRLMAEWRGLSVEQLAAAIGISPAMARNMHRMIYEFPNKRLGQEAIRAYTGVVFKAFDYGSLPADACHRVSNNVRVISSLYGILRPDDFIKAYRLDFTTRMPGLDANMAAFWRPAVTDILLDTLKSGGHGEIIDLLPADAAKCIDWKRIKEAASVIKIDFRVIPASGDSGTVQKYKAPPANRLKTLRGRLLRKMMTDDIRTTDELMRVETPEFAADTELSTPEKTVFLTD